MSHNVHNAKTLSCSLRMSPASIRKWAERWKQLPEGIAGDMENLEESLEDSPEGEDLPLDAFRWDGENSGRTYPELLVEFVADLKGEADVILVWDERHTALRIKDGAVTEHEVVMAIGEKVKTFPAP